MTEQDWLTCADPERMLDLVGTGDERRLKLLAAACCRRVWSLLLFDASRQSVEVVERFADDLEGDWELGEAGVAAYNVELGIQAVVHPPSSYDIDEQGRGGVPASHRVRRLPWTGGLCVVAGCRSTLRLGHHPMGRPRYPEGHRRGGVLGHRRRG